MIGAEAARCLNQRYVGPTVHRRGSSIQGMFVDAHVRLSRDVIAEGNLCPNYLHILGQELSMLDREIFEEFLGKVSAEVNNLAIEGRHFGTCPMLLTAENCPGLFHHVRQTTLFAITRNYMGKLALLIYHEEI